MNILTKIIVFTLTEAVAFAGGLYLWNAHHHYLSILFWTIVTFFEHVWAYNTGANKSFFSIPK